MRAVKNVYDDKCVIPGAGAFEIAAYCMLEKYAEEIKGKARMGVKSFAESLLVIPKVLADNSGYDS